MVEEVPELLQHVTQRRFGAGDALHLLVVEGIDRRQLGEIAELFETGHDEARGILLPPHAATSFPSFSASRAARKPSAPGLTPTGDR